MIMIIANNCVQYTDITTYLSVCVCVFEQYEFMLWKIFTYNLARACRRGERGGAVCVMVTLKINTHVCLGHLFCQTATRQRRFTFTHTHTDVEQTKWASAKERKRSVCFVLSVCESVGDLSLSLTLFLRLHLPIMKCIQIHPRNQLVCLFCMFVTLSFSPFLVLILIQRIVQIAAKLLLCLSIFLILSQPAASTHKIQKKEAKKNAEKQTLYRKLFLFWTLTQSYDDFVLLPHLREWDARRRAGTGRRSFSFSHSLSCSRTRTRTCFRSVLLTRSRDKCFVSGQIKIMKQARILFNCTRT